MIVRAMTQDDTEAVTQLEARVFCDAWSKDSVESMLRGGCYMSLVAVLDERVIGYCLIMHAADEAEILRIAVEESCRRAGTGRLLLTEALKLLKEQGYATKVFLEVRSHNIPAIALYEGMGFVRTGLRRDYYSNPTDDAVLMART